MALVSEPVADIEGMNCPFWLTYRNVKKKKKKVYCMYWSVGAKRHMTSGTPALCDATVASSTLHLSQVVTSPPARCSMYSFKTALKTCSKDTEECNKAVQAES